MPSHVESPTSLCVVSEVRDVAAMMVPVIGLSELELGDQDGTASLRKEQQCQRGSDCRIAFGKPLSLPVASEIILRRDGERVADVIHAKSATADVVILGLQDPRPGTAADYAGRLIELAEGLRTTIVVRNAGEFAGNLI